MAVVKRRPMTARDNQEWEEELALWGIKEPEPETESEIELWPEHQRVIEWWLSIPDFLRFNHSVCLGMNVSAVHADCQLSGFTPEPCDYQKLKLIARTLAQELNQREQSKS